MIVKYLDNGVWGYIDNVRQAAKQDIDCHDLIMKYYEVYSEKEPEGITSMDGEELPTNIAASNKVFWMATNAESANIEVNNIISDACCYGNNRQKNIIDGGRALDNSPGAIVALYLNDHKEYDTLVLVTNQQCYLMNDKGQTIERLV